MTPEVHLWARNGHDRHAAIAHEDHDCVARESMTRSAATVLVRQSASVPHVEHFLDTSMQPADEYGSDCASTTEESLASHPTATIARNPRISEIAVSSPALVVETIRD